MTAVGAVDLTADPLPDEPLTDVGNARRLVAAFGHRLRYVAPWRRWLTWDGRRWALDETGETARCAKAVGRGLLLHGVDEPDLPARGRYLKAGQRAESAQGVRATLELASTEIDVVVRPDQLDADPHLLNVTNGVLDLRTGQLGPHDPSLLLTKTTAAAYDPDAEQAGWAAFLARVQPDPRMREYLGRLLGHALLGQVVEHVLPVLHGPGANGKSTLLEAVTAALGDYASTADPALLLDGDWQHPTGVADLFGRRLVVAHETDAGRRLAEGTVKRLTGGDTVKARRMREDFWSFTPTHTLLLITNHAPQVRGDDEAIWRRLRLVPFGEVIPESERDPHLRDRLTLELDGVLAWLVAGHEDWKRRGLADPDPVRAATAGYRAESDALGRWLDEHTLTGPHYWARAADLFAAWATWCRAENTDPGTATAFGRRLTDRGYRRQKGSGGVHRWHGLALAGTDDEGRRP